ncbi:hypothetical protein TWF281_000363 [Arthrobotrys megalospora]
MRGLRLQVKVVSQPSHNPKGRNLAPIAEFLHLAAPNVTLEDLSLLITDKYARLYPRNRPLNIQRLQDSEGNDLDLTYTVGDVFDDKSSNRDGSIVKVIHKDILRDESVPPESGLRPAGSKKRSIQSLAPVAESEESPEGGEEVEEEIGVPVNLHRNKRQRLGTGSDESVEVEEIQQEEEIQEETPEGQNIEEEPEVPPVSSNTVEPSRSRPRTLSQHSYVAESSTGGAGLRSPSLGPEALSGAMNHDSLLPPNHFTRDGVQQRGSSLIPETSQGLGELLSPKEETFSSPLFTATTNRRVLPSSQLVEISSPESEELDAPVIAPHTLRGSGGRKSTSTTPKQGTLKRPAKAMAKKPSPRNQTSVYELEDTESEPEEAEQPVPQKRKVNSQPLKKFQGPVSRRVLGRRPGGSSSTPTLEVPSSQTDTIPAPRILNDFVVEIPHIEEVRRSRERELSNTPVQNVADLIGSKSRPEEDSATGTGSSQDKFTKPSLPAKNQPRAGKGSKQPEASITVEKSPVKETRTPITLTAKRTTASRSKTPQSATPEINIGKSAGSSSVLLSAMRSPDKRNLEAKKSVSFANEGSPVPIANVTVAASATKTAGTASKPTPELRKPRTTFKVPMPVIPLELQGIGDQSTVEGKKKYEAFVGKPSRARSTSSTPPIATLSSTPASSRIVVKGKPKRGDSADTDDGSIIVKGSPTRNTQPVTNTAKDTLKKKGSPSPVSDEENSSADEVMEDAPPVSTKPSTQKSSSPVSSSSESESASESEEESDDDDDSEEEEETDNTPKKASPKAEKETAKSQPPAAPESESESEAEAQGEFVDIKKIMELSDSDAETHAESVNKGRSKAAMTREESPIKGPGKRQLRSTSPEKSGFVQVPYAAAPSKLALKPISGLAPGSHGNSGTPSSDEEDEVENQSDQDMVDQSENEDEDEDVDDAEDEGLETAHRKSKTLLPAPDIIESGPRSRSESIPPPSSISVIPESSLPKPPTEEESGEESGTDTATSPSKEDSSSEEDSDDESSEEEPEKPAPPKKVDTTAKAMNALFRSPAPKLPNGNLRTTPSRFSKTPEPSQPAAGPSKLPPSRMNRRTLGYISPSPGPPSSMPARLPSMMSPKDLRKRHSLTSHYKGLSMLSQQDIPETRDGGKSAGAATAAAAGVGASQKPKPRLSEGMKSFQNILSSQKGGKDSDDDSDSDDSDDSEDEGKGEKEEEKSKGRIGLSRFLPFL